MKELSKNTGLVSNKLYTVLLGSISVMYDNWIPYASGCLISQALKSEKVRSQFQFLTPFYKNNEQLEPLLEQTDILGLTCYIWNQAINDEIAKRFKKLHPQGVVLYGGPNIPESENLFFEFASKRPQVDLHFCGMSETAFTHFLENFQTIPMEKHQGCFGLNEQGHLFNNTVTTQRYNQIDIAMPTPYQEGIFDPIFQRDKALKASFETNRGCPYGCSYCDWGGQSRTKIKRFDPVKVRETVELLFSYKNIREIEILDANFGIFEEDLATVRYMAEQRKKYKSNAKVSYSGLAKNGSKYLPEILRIITDELGAQQRNIKLSFQSHTQAALTAMNRGNIKNSKLIDLLKDIRDNHEITSEMIIGMVGETAETWLSTLEKDFELKIDYMRPYILHVVSNTELYSPAYKEKFKIKTRTVRFPYDMSGKGYSSFLLNPKWRATESEEHEEVCIVTECSSYDLTGLHKMFDYWWFYHNFYNSRALYQTLQFLVEGGMSFSQIILHFFKTVSEKHPLLSALLEKNRRIVDDIFNPEKPETILDLETYFFFSRCLRSDELHQLYNRRDVFKGEILDIFKDIPGASSVIEKDLASFKSLDSQQPTSDLVSSLYGMNAKLGGYMEMRSVSASSPGVFLT